ncbi:hypothetical protein L9Z17_07370 [Leptospira noguchii]|nr:hypothetical protein [Leptospira noguchii]MCH1911738.1 hypothetical protein [Leptospira noguchii]
MNFSLDIGAQFYKKITSASDPSDANAVTFPTENVTEAKRSRGRARSFRS